MLYLEGGGPWYDDRNPFVRRSTQRGMLLLERLMAAPQALESELQTKFRLSNPYDAYRIGGSFQKSIAPAFTRR